MSSNEEVVIDSYFHISYISYKQKFQMYVEEKKKSKMFSNLACFFVRSTNFGTNLDQVVMTMPVVNKNVYNNNIRYEICTITINSYSSTIIMIITVGHSVRTRSLFPV